MLLNDVTHLANPDPVLPRHAPPRCEDSFYHRVFHPMHRRKALVRVRNDDMEVPISNMTAEHARDFPGFEVGFDRAEGYRELGHGDAAVGKEAFAVGVGEGREIASSSRLPYVVQFRAFGAYHHGVGTQAQGVSPAASFLPQLSLAHTLP